jgi:hypothetical protein
MRTPSKSLCDGTPQWKYDPGDLQWCAGRRYNTGLISRRWPFVAYYAINGDVQDPVLSETNSTILTIPMTESGIISFVSFNDRNCPGDPNGAFNVTVLQPGESFLNASVCEGDSVHVGGHIVGFPGNYTFLLENAAENGCDSIIHLDLQVFEIMNAIWSVRSEKVNLHCWLKCM